MRVKDGPLALDISRVLLAIMEHLYPSKARCDISDDDEWKVVDKVSVSK